MTVGRIPVIEGGIQPTLLDAKADLITATANDTPARIGVGANDTVLTADSSTATGLKWAAPAASSGPAFAAVRATTIQSVSQSTFTKVQLNSEQFDTDGCFDSTTNYRFTPTKAGKYQINVCTLVTMNSVSRVLSALYKNGSSFIRFYDNTTSADSPALSGAVLVDMNGTTDYLELYVYMTATTSSIDTYTGGTGTIFSGSWIRS